jgi:transcriptional regulator with XRE-family HTH domain
MDGRGRIRALRVSKGRSLEAVALVAEVDPATISRVERSLVEPQRDTIARIAKGLRVSPKRLWSMAIADWEDSTAVESNPAEIPEPVA